MWTILFNVSVSVLIFAFVMLAGIAIYETFTVEPIDLSENSED